MSEIIKGKLYLGDMFDACDPKLFEFYQIDTIICVASRLKVTNTNPKIRMYQFDFEDDYSCKINEFFDEINTLIKKNKTVLVHCAAGVSRSATIVLAYLIQNEKLSLEEAFLKVRERRPRICPNKEFMKHLIDFEFRVHGKNALDYEEYRQLFFYS